MTGRRVSRRAVGRRWAGTVLLASLVTPSFPPDAVAAQPAGPIAQSVGPSGPPVEPVSPPHSQTRTLRSKIVGAEYRLFISLPWRYHETDRTYPVLYATDANGNFAILHGALQALAERFRSGSHAGLEIAVRILEGENHRSGMARAWSLALRALYPERTAASGGSP